MRRKTTTDSPLHVELAPNTASNGTDNALERQLKQSLAIEYGSNASLDISRKDDRLIVKVSQPLPTIETAALQTA